MTASLALVLLLTAGPAAPPALPDSEAGRRAAAFLDAYNSGDESRLRAFYETSVSAAGKARRSVADRMDVARGMRDEHGRLTLVAVRDAAPDHVSVEVRAEQGGLLALDVLCEPEPPHHFAALRIVDLPGGAEEPAAQAGAPMAPAEVAAALRDHLVSLGDAFSGAVLLARRDEVLVRAGYGLASRERGQASTPETRFNLGSIDKAFTRVAIEQLAAAGRLALTDTLDRWVPEYPVEKGRRITIGHLLDHRGGTGDFFGPRFDAADHAKLLTLRDWLPLIADEPLHFEPGTRNEYSNAGYLLLGLVIEKASGLSYDDYLKQHVFGPAGMSHTGATTLAEGGTTLATGYTRRGSGWTNNRATLPARGTSAGGGYSTVDDLFAFAKALRAGRFGKPVGSLGIAGGSPGVNAFLMIEGEWTAAVMANVDAPAAERVGAQLRGWLRREERR